MSTYSHGSISLDVYIEVIEWLNILNPKVNRNMHVWNFWSHSMTWSSRRIVWCNRLSELFLDKDYSHTNDCWRVFMKKSWIGFYITLICGVDDLIIKVYIRHEIHTIMLRRIFGLNQIMLSLWLEHIPLRYQSSYIRKYLRSSIWIYYIKDTYGHVIPNMGYRSLRHRGDGEVIEEHELPYLNTIEALIYLAKYVRPDTIVFGNLLRVQFPERYKVCVRNILGYIQGTKGLDQFHSKNQDGTMVWYIDSG